MSKVYMVTSGDYSSYSVEAVFSSEEKATEYLATYKGYIWDGAGIEDIEIDEPYSKLENNGRRVKCFEATCDYSFNIELPEEFDWGYKSVNPGFYCFKGPRLIMHWKFDADKYTPERATKVLAEKAAEIKATGLWGKAKECKRLYSGGGEA